MLKVFLNHLSPRWLVGFLIIFSLELTLRLYVYRLSFFDFRKPGWKWNWFDFFVVATQMSEELVKLYAAGGSTDGTSPIRFPCLLVGGRVQEARAL